MARLRLSFLGSPRVERQGETVDIGSNKALALLVYLAVTGRSHNRDSLGALLWPDSDKSRAYLRHSLWALKKSVGRRWLEASREQISFLADADVWLDVSAFRAGIAGMAGHTHAPGTLCAGCLHQLEEAVALYQDTFLTGFSLPDAPAFDEWQFFQAEELRQALAAALEKLVHEHSARGAFDRAATFARRWMALDPLHEVTQRTLMRLYALDGQQAAALRQYEECVRLLEMELGVEPEAETTALYEAIKRRRLGPATSEEQPAVERPVPATAGNRSAVLARAAEEEGAGRYAAALELLEPLLSSDPADQMVHRALMKLYVLSGRRHDALRHYQHCLGTLRAMGRTPEPETETLYQRIVLGDMTPPLAASPKPIWLPPTPILEEVAHNIPLVGRKRELISLQTKMRAAREGRGRTILIAGEAGVGKTRLAYELLRSAAMFRMTSLMGAAYEQEENLPYQPFVEAFNRYLVEQNRPQDQNPITHFKPIGSSDIQQEHSALFKSAANFLRELAVANPTVLLLDDLHAADEATLALFHYLARHTRALPLILLATYRTDLTMPPTAPFGRLLNALYREQSADVLHLSGLNQEESALLINHILAGDAEAMLVEFLLEIAEGNPFFTQEITRAYHKTGDIYQEQGRWRLRPLPSPLVPSQLRELLRERVQRLGSAVEPVLTAAAAMGRDFHFRNLRAIVSLPDHELLDVLDAALDGYLLEETDEGYRFRHSLIRRTLYDGLSRERRRWLHTRVAEVLEESHRDTIISQVEALAYHYNQSNERRRALPYLLQAAQKAMAIYAMEVARDYFQQALQLMDELPCGEPAERWQALEGLGRCSYTLADTQKAVSAFEQALALAPAAGWKPDPEAQLYLRLLAAFALTTAGDMSAANRHLELALAERGEITEASSEVAYLWYNIAMWAWHRHEYQKAFEAAQRSLAVAAQVDDPEAIARAYEMLALTAHSLGNWQQGLDFEAQRAALVGQRMDVTWAFDAHL